MFRGITQRRGPVVTDSTTFFDDGILQGITHHQMPFIGQITAGSQFVSLYALAPGLDIVERDRVLGHFITDIGTEQCTAQ